MFCSLKRFIGAQSTQHTGAKHTHVRTPGCWQQHQCRISSVLCTAADGSVSFQRLHKKNGTRFEHLRDGWFQWEGLKMKYLTVVKNTSVQFHTAGFNAHGLLKRQLLPDAPMKHCQQI